MSFDIADYFNKFSDNMLSSPTVNTIIGNPILSSIGLGLIVAILIMLVFMGETHKALRIGFWTMILSSFVIFLIHKKYEKEYYEQHKIAGFEAAFAPEDALNPFEISSGLL
jgi:hypothetical protein